MKTFCIATNAACLEHLPLVEKLSEFWHIDFVARYTREKGKEIKIRQKKLHFLPKKQKL